MSDFELEVRFASEPLRAPATRSDNADCGRTERLAEAMNAKRVERGNVAAKAGSEPDELRPEMHSGKERRFNTQCRSHG